MKVRALMPYPYLQEELLMPSPEGLRHKGKGSGTTQTASC